LEQTTISYKLIKKVKDEKFDVEHLHHYSLSVQLGVRDFQLCIIDTRDNCCLVLEDYVLSKVDSYSQLIEILASLFDDHQLLKAGFWKSVKFSIKNSKFTLVPSPLFDRNQLYEYLNASCKISPKRESFLYYKHIKSDVVNSFAVPKDLLTWINGIYANSTVLVTHQSSALIEGVLKKVTHYPGPTMYLYIDRFKLHIITSSNGELQYYNQFTISKFADYMKFIMMVMQGLKYNQKSTHIVLWGYIGRQSPHFTEFNKYFKNISFGDRPDYLKFGYLFDELQDHHYFDLYSTYLCD